MDKVVGIDEAVADIQDGATIMIGGFLANGAPENLVDALIKNDVKDITLITTDTAIETRGCGKLIADKRIKKLYASHIGTNRETGKQMNAGTLDVELVPQGTLAERIRSAGFGLGGFLTKTGVGTRVEEGKEKLTIDNEEYLLELPLKADYALVYAEKADEQGNLVYKGSKLNFNHVMAAAAETTIVEVEHVVKTGELDPNLIVTPGVFVNRIVDGGNLDG